MGQTRYALQHNAPAKMVISTGNTYRGQATAGKQYTLSGTEGKSKLRITQEKPILIDRKMIEKNEMIAEGSGCVLLDIASYDGLTPPAVRITSMLADDFEKLLKIQSLRGVLERFPQDDRLTRRYTCRWYSTLSKCYKERFNSKCIYGYPIVAPPEELCGKKYLICAVTREKETNLFVIPVEIRISPEKPFAPLKLIVAKTDDFQWGYECTVPTFTEGMQVRKYHTPSLRSVDETDMTPLDYDRILRTFESEPMVFGGKVLLYKTPIPVNGMTWEEAAVPGL